MTFGKSGQFYGNSILKMLLLQHSNSTPV